eukprot:TRINITY_DN924_c0_g1_i1.p1 TRINITY_DN924_c0_g1~~TRINITY_DN924_c0_g1_i1.p1  ORF type:complete len:278 (-),score=63.81 TRINITY_DN924_c0_g1_i1:121-954(-)
MVVFFFFFFFNDTATTEIYTRSIVGSVRCVQETGYQRRVHGETQNVTGVIIVVMNIRENNTYITGMFEGRRHHHHSFEFGAKIVNFTNSSGSIFIQAEYFEGRIGRHSLPEVHGKCNITGTIGSVKYFGYGSNQGKSHHFNITGAGYNSHCPFYTMDEAASRAGILIGENAHEYEAANVVNYAVLGYPFIPSANASYYHDVFGEKANSTAPGVVIVGNDYKHIAIVDKEGDKFIHSVHAKKVIIATPVSQINTYFPKGYVLKSYHCYNINHTYTEQF